VCRGYRRAHVEAAVARVPGARSRDVYRALATGIVELIVLFASRRRRRAMIDGLRIAPELARAIDTARGPVVVFASHTGNWELAAAAAAQMLARRGRSLFVVAKRMSVGLADAFVRALRARLGVRTIAPRGALAEARRVLARGDVVAMPIDQVPDRCAHAIAAPFLGQQALVDRAPATLAWRARATVVVVAASRDAGAHRLDLLAVFAPSDDRAAWIRDVTRAATTELDRFVRAHPSDWLWLHRRWSLPRSDLVARTGARYAGLLE
jgi:Kdo2-lipid IVA lauroyltransferase/acyltransferase